MARAAEAETQTQARDIRERFNQQVEAAKQRFGDKYESARDRVEDARAQATDIWDDTVDYIRENPGKLIAFSLAVGLALGAYLRFSRRTVEEFEVD